ncbi:MAG: hypothetical protein WBE81_14220 [Pseudolabrys sp.]
MDPTERGALISLGSIIGVCGAVLLWVHGTSAAPLDFIKRHLGFTPDDGDGSIEVLLVTVLVMSSLWRGSAGHLSKHHA